jgi:hypothetical protein
MNMKMKRWNNANKHLWFHNTPIWMFFYIVLHIIIYLIKNLTKKKKPNEKKKTWLKKKSTMCINSSSWMYHLKSLSYCISILHHNLSNIIVSNALVNKFARLSFKQICLISISPQLSRSCVKFFFYERCFVLSSLMYPPFNWVMHVILSLYSMVDVCLLEDKPHVRRICWVIDLIHIYSQLAS